MHGKLKSPFGGTLSHGPRPPGASSATSAPSPSVRSALTASPELPCEFETPGHAAKSATPTSPAAPQIPGCLPLWSSPELDAESAPLESEVDAESTPLESAAPSHCLISRMAACPAAGVHNRLGPRGGSSSSQGSGTWGGRLVGCEGAQAVGSTSCEDGHMETMSPLEAVTHMQAVKWKLCKAKTSTLHETGSCEWLHRSTLHKTTH